MTTIPEDELWALPLESGFKSKKIIELGNKKNSSGLYRDWYVSRGADYQCLDWNGQDGAISVDMGYPIEPRLVGIADLVTNFGFTEHVYTDQAQCWKNVAWLSSKIACHLAIVLPHPKHWDHHGVYQPHLEWLEEWCLKNGYDIFLAKVNKDRRRWVNVISATRVEPFVEENYHTPSFAGMYITPPGKRVNKLEKACGVQP